jgi:glutathione S-transferase
VLKIGEFMLSESTAIMIYLALTYPKSELLENSPIGLARALEWMNWLSSIHASIIAQSWRTERFSDDMLAHKGIQTKGMKNLFEISTQIDTKLEGINWAVGDKYSIADPFLLVFYRWGNRLGLDMRQFEHWTIHAEKMEQRKAVKSVLNAEGVSIWE